MNRPVVSVVIPAFNAATTLKAALRSVRRQTLRDFECMIVDDGSTDETIRIARQFALNDSRFVVEPVNHAGIVQALNCGISRCRGRYIARFDADDFMCQERLKCQYEALELAPELHGVGCHVRLFPRRELTDGHKAYEAWLNSLTSEGDVSRDRFIECPLAHPTLFARRSTFEEFPYRDVPWPEDYDLILRWLGAGRRLGIVPLPLLLWRDSGGRLSRTDNRYAIPKFFECKAQFLARDWLKDEVKYILWGYGDTGRQLCRALERSGRTPSYIVERHPRRIGQRIYGAMVISPDELHRLPSPRLKIVVSVAGFSPRNEVREAARRMGLVDGTDYICAA